MQPTVLFSIGVVLVFVVLCALCTVVLRRAILLRGQGRGSSPNTLHFTIDPRVLTPYGNLVRSTLAWLDDHYIPINGFTRPVIDHLGTAFGIDASGNAPNSPEQQSNNQTQGIFVPLEPRRPPPAYV